MQEKFLPTDIPETYEKKIRLLLLQISNNNANALAILWNHLPDKLFSRMEITALADIDAFFTNLKDIWLKRQPSTFIYNGNRSLSIIATNLSSISYHIWAHLVLRFSSNQNLSFDQDPQL
ncbi:hypothetical protein Glove_420g42 [Diversispora epigaea]|uniref:Uncharacterized protein n=1 Tax=Diversispora epigaea TaxID=1348612 RepID=A0A397GXR9_9GLOM|nr:hypothetical protein Glove_420g42 [Diversispora epigaea]